VDRLALLVDSFPPVLDLGVKADGVLLERVLDLTDVPVEPAHEVLLLAVTLELLLGIELKLPFPRVALAHDREIVETKHDILRRHDDRRAVGWMQNVVR